MLTQTNDQKEIGSIYSSERQAKFDLECTLIDDPDKIESKRNLEKKFVGFSRAFRYLSNFAKGSMTLLPLAAYINPDYEGIENIVAGVISTITIPALIGLCYVAPSKGIKMTENEYKRRVDVLEQKLEELER